MSTRKRVRPSPWAGPIVTAAFVAITAWGALAFGAVYPWAFVPLAFVAAGSGLAGLVIARGKGAHVSIPLAVSLLLIGIAVSAQLVPLSRETLAAVSPATPAVLAQIDPLFANTPGSTHPISIHPAQTRTALFLFCSFAILIAGAARWFSLKGAAGFARSLAVIGVLMAIIGVVQRALFNGKLYGFWMPRLWGPETLGDAFGPFVNKHHFAGWTLMALFVTLGLLCARLSRAGGSISGWRDRMIWVTSAEASQAVLLAGAAFAMAAALVLTMSRSGIAAMVAGLVAMVWFVLRGGAARSRKLLAVTAVAGMLVLAVLWVGEGLVVRHFANADWETLNDRSGAARDAWHIAQLFPWTGTGLNTYGIATLLFQTHSLEFHYAHAHNDYLQLAAEGGLLVGVPAILCLSLLVRDIRRRFREDRDSSAYWLRAGAVAALLAIGLQEAGDFSLQMPGNAVLFAVVCGIALHRTPVATDKLKATSTTHG